MKKLTFKFAFLFFVTLLATCVEKDYYITEAPEEARDESTYTIMMYGCGGENLDLPMVTNIREALLAGSTDRVKFTGQIKFSAKYQEHEEPPVHNASLWVLLPKIGTHLLKCSIRNSHFTIHRT